MKVAALKKKLKKIGGTSEYLKAESIVRLREQRNP